MRIAVVTPILPIPQDPTRGRFIDETTRALSDLADVRVYLTQAQYPTWLQPRNHPSQIVPSDFTLPGLKVTPVTYPALPLVSRLSNGLASGWALQQPIAAFQPDLILAYWVYPEGAGAAHVARRLKKPLVIGALGTDINERHGLNARLTRNALHKADAVVTVSQAMARFTHQTYGVPADRIHTVVNGINTTVFHPQDPQAMRQALSVSASSKLVVYVGRLIEAKGLRELLASFAALQSTFTDSHLVLIGEGGFKATLLASVQEAGLQDRVTLTGGLLPAEVARWVNAADVLTLPSWTEGYPNVLVEALACGCPIVATDVGGIPEIVDAHNGLLVPAKNVPALTQALQTALSTQWDRLGIATRMRRTWGDVARETLAVCRGLLG